MNRYETLFLIKPNQNDEEIQSIITRITDRVAQADGKVAAIDHWGIRRMAYTVQYRGERLNKGYYVLLTYLGDGKVVDEVERNIKIIDPAFRYLSVKLADNVDPDSVTEVEVTRRSDEAHAPAPQASEPSAEEPSEASPETPEEAGADTEDEESGSEPGDEDEAASESSDEENKE